MKKIIQFLIALVPLACHAQDYATRQLDASPRHQEWVEVKAGNKTVHNFVVYPQTATKATVVIVIHENRGLTDWVRSFADQLAAEGYIAIAPDLLSGFAPGKEKTSDFSSQQAATEAIYQLKPENVTSYLDAVQQYAANLQAGNGKTVCIGFCWGGGQSFRMAATNSQIKAALVFYGACPQPEVLKTIQAPVYGFYAENDERINSGIAAAADSLKALHKTYDYQFYKGAGHAFMRSGDDPAGPPANKQARNDAWERIRKILAGI